jgi:hypothetical protein
VTKTQQVPTSTKEAPPFSNGWHRITILLY